ncbi:hypothetical protein [Solidesulfovibrio sp.]
MLEAVMRRILPLLLTATLLLTVAGCYDPPETAKRYVNAPYLFSFIPPKGWTVTEEKTAACLTSVEARHGDCRFYICVSERPEDFLPTTSDFANCELVKEYVAATLKGYNVSCRPSTTHGRRSYDAIYLRNVADEDGKVRLQLVRQTFLSRGKILYTLTTYAFGQNGEDLKAATTPCEAEIARTQDTFFLHQPGASGQ